MDPVTILNALKLVGGVFVDVIKLLLDPKVWLLMAVVALLAYVKGCEMESEHFKSWRDAAEAVGKQQEERTKQINARNRALQKEVDDAHARDVARDERDLADTDDRLRRDANRGFLPGPGPRPPKPVPARSAEVLARETEFLRRVYLGVYVCYSGDKLDKDVRAGYDGLLSGLAPLAQQSIDALDDALWWGQWGVKVGACSLKGSAGGAPPTR